MSKTPVDDIYYCGFNGFKQVPSQPDRHTLTTLVSAQAKPIANARTIVDVAICWNYLVIAEPDRITKYGLVHGRNGQERIGLPPGCEGGISQLSATPRHLLAVTGNGGKFIHKLRELHCFLGENMDNI